MDMGTPYMEITVQPINQFHFRYISEMNESHGYLTGALKKTWPAVRLCDFNGEALIRCSLYQTPKPGKEPLPHPHLLIVRNDTNFDFTQDEIKYKKDPHEVTVSQANGHQATFKEMKIINRKVCEVKDELFGKFVAKSKFNRGSELTPDQKNEERKSAEKSAKTVNLNQVVLCFEAYEWTNDKWVRLCTPVFSKPINEKRSAPYGELEISRISTVVGRATGNEDIFLFVKKVDKKNIRVRFYEQDGNGEKVWQAWGKDVYVHYQYAIALKTPPYRTANITENAKVFIQLYRSHDEATSDPIEFRYKPIDIIDGNRKRPRTSSSGYDTDVSGVSDQSSQHRIQPNRQVQQNPNPSLDEVFALMPELNKVEYNPKEIEEAFNWIVNDCRNRSEHSMLAKDCVSNEAGDEAKSQDLLKKVEKFVLKFLEIPLLKSCNADDPEFHIARKLCAYAFERIIFNGRNTIIHLCVRSNDRPLMERLLEIIHKFELDELLNVQNYDQETCTHLACVVNNVSLLQKMVGYGADVNLLDWNGNTPLHVAIQNAHNDCVSALLNTSSTSASDQKINIDLDVFNDTGYTPLHAAAVRNNLNAVEMLTHKAIQTQCLSIFDDMDIKHGQNALHIAIESRAYEVAEYLIKNECISPSNMNRSGHTAVDLARNANAVHLVEIMEQFEGANDECFLNNSDDSGNGTGSDAENSFELQDTNKEADIGKLTKLDEETFDEKCYDELSVLLNVDEKWKSIANDLGYQHFIGIWQESSNPTKILLTYAEALKVPKDRLIEIFEKLDEERAIHCIHEWNHR